MTQCDGEMNSLRHSLHHSSDINGNNSSSGICAQCRRCGRIVSQHTDIPLSHMNYDHQHHKQHHNNHHDKHHNQSQQSHKKHHNHNHNHSEDKHGHNNITIVPSSSSSTSSTSSNSSCASREKANDNAKEKERELVLSMERELEALVVGQDEAVQRICQVIRLSKAGLRFHDRPIGVFFLLGPTVSSYYTTPCYVI